MGGGGISNKSINSSKASSSILVWNIFWVPICSTSKISDGWRMIWGSISAYTKKRLMSFSDDKELSLGVDDISWNFLKKMYEKDKIYKTLT